MAYAVIVEAFHTYTISTNKILGSYNSYTEALKNAYVYINKLGIEVTHVYRYNNHEAEIDGVNKTGWSYEITIIEHED